MDFPQEREREQEREAASQTLRFPVEHAVNAFGHRVVEVGFGRVCAYVCVTVQSNHGLQVDLAVDLALAVQGLCI